MKNLLIIGARGLGREVYHLSTQCKGHLQEYMVKGFLDDKTDALDSFTGYPPIISSVEKYEVLEDDIFVCALGDSHFKKKYAEMILSKQGNFYSLIHPNTHVTDQTEIGEGAIIFQNTVISCNVTIGNFVTIHCFSDFGHDVKVGNYCSFEAYSFLGGFAEVEDLVTLHTRAAVIPHKKIKRGATIGAGSVVIRHVPEGITVHGNPAKKLF